MENGPKLKGILVVHTVDDCPDTSYLGDYTDNYSDDNIIAVGKHEGEFCSDVPEDELPEKGRDYRYFRPVTENYTGCEDLRKYCLQDYKRMKDLSKGDWCYIGIETKAQVLCGGIIQIISSGGIWGVESDADKCYIGELEQEELTNLWSQLEIIGCDLTNWDECVKSAERLLE